MGTGFTWSSGCMWAGGEELTVERGVHGRGELCSILAVLTRPPGESERSGWPWCAVDWLVKQTGWRDLRRKRRRSCRIVA